MIFFRQGGEIMTYYKIIKDGEFVGVGTSYELRRFQKKHGMLIVSDENTAQYIQIGDVLYRDNWFKVITSNTILYETAEVSVICEDEYQQLFEAVEKGAEISVPVENDDDSFQNDVTVTEELDVTVEYLKSQKIKEMSYICNQMITNGFDIELSDKKSHHFSLTVQDQLNLITLSAMVSSGEAVIPYHADNELCEYFSASDIGLVIKTSTELKAYHTTYYNSLKLYIQSLDNRETIADVYYGMHIPEEYESDVLKTFISSQSSTGEILNEERE